jgi:hypothetical protein
VNENCLFDGLQDRAEPTSLHCVDGLDGVKVFDEQRACGLLLFCVGDLQGVGQGSQSFDRVVVRFSYLLGLVGVHRLEDLAKGGVGCLVWIDCVGHGYVSEGKEGLNRLRNINHEAMRYESNQVIHAKIPEGIKWFFEGNVDRMFWPRWRPNTHRITRRTCKQNATVANVAQPVAIQRIMEEWDE